MTQASESTPQLSLSPCGVCVCGVHVVSVCRMCACKSVCVCECHLGGTFGLVFRMESTFYLF